MLQWRFIDLIVVVTGKNKSDLVLKKIASGVLDSIPVFGLSLLQCIL